MLSMIFRSNNTFQAWVQKRRWPFLLAGGIGLLVSAVVVMPFVAGILRAHKAGKCIDLLAAIDGAKNQCALDHRDSTVRVLGWDSLKPYLIFETIKSLPRCPSGGEYRINPLGEDPTCSIATHKLALGPVNIRVEDGRLHGIAEATVEVLDNSGRMIRTKSDANGVVRIHTWPQRALALIITKNGYLPVSNSWPCNRNIVMTIN